MTVASAGWIGETPCFDNPNISLYNAMSNQSVIVCNGRNKTAEASHQYVLY